MQIEGREEKNHHFWAHSVCQLVLRTISSFDSHSNPTGTALLLTQDEYNEQRGKSLNSHTTSKWQKQDLVIQRLTHSMLKFFSGQKNPGPETLFLFIHLSSLCMCAPSVLSPLCKERSWLWHYLSKIRWSRSWPRKKKICDSPTLCQASLFIKLAPQRTWSCSPSRSG